MHARISSGPLHTFQCGHATLAYTCNDYLHRARVLHHTGLEPTAAPGSIQARATALTTGVLNQSTLALFLLDAR